MPQFDTSEAWALVLADVGPFFGLETTDYNEAKRNTFFATDGTLEVGISLRSFVAFAHDTIREVPDRKALLMKFMRALVVAKVSDGAKVDVEPSQVLRNMRIYTVTAR